MWWKICNVTDNPYLSLSKFFQWATGYKSNEVESVPLVTMEATSPVAAAAQEQTETPSDPSIEEVESSTNHSPPASEL